MKFLNFIFLQVVRQVVRIIPSICDMNGLFGGKRHDVTFDLQGPDQFGAGDPGRPEVILFNDPFSGHSFAQSVGYPATKAVEVEVI